MKDREKRELRQLIDECHERADRKLPTREREARKAVRETCNSWPLGQKVRDEH